MGFKEVQNHLYILAEIIQAAIISQRHVSGIYSFTHAPPHLPALPLLQGRCTAVLRTTTGNGFAVNLAAPGIIRAAPGCKPPQTSLRGCIDLDQVKLLGVIAKEIRLRLRAQTVHDYHILSCSHDPDPESFWQ